MISIDLQNLLDDARFWAKEEIYPPLEAATRFHHRLLQIHPLQNGNGRHTRISAYLYLSEYSGHAPID